MIKHGSYVGNRYLHLKASDRRLVGDDGSVDCSHRLVAWGFRKVKPYLNATSYRKIVVEAGQDSSQDRIQKKKRKGKKKNEKYPDRPLFAETMPQTQ